MGHQSRHLTRSFPRQLPLPVAFLSRRRSVWSERATKKNRSHRGLLPKFLPDVFFCNFWRWKFGIVRLGGSVEMNRVKKGVWVVKLCVQTERYELLLRIQNQNFSFFVEKVFWSRVSFFKNCINEYHPLASSVHRTEVIEIDEKNYFEIWMY